jgi:hypothetical protein
VQQTVVTCPWLLSACLMATVKRAHDRLFAETVRVAERRALA